MTDVEAERRAQVVEAIEACDSSIERHRDELGRLLGLRTSLAAQLDALGGKPLPVAAEHPAARTEGERAARTWLTELEETGHSPALPMDDAVATMAMPVVTPARGEPGVIAVRNMPTIVNGEHRYERVLINASDIPRSAEVWIGNGPNTDEAHLAPYGRFTGQARCGHYAPLSRWWRADGHAMDHEVELCKPCAYTLASHLDNAQQPVSQTTAHRP